ncbi:MAG: hypothetical protein M3Z09_13810 [Acidobacteriota bacterium]|nr:hypothetical protein [Acidobacteriota bacterium]
MPRFNFILAAALAASTMQAQAQSVLDTIRTPEKAVATVNQSLEGTWLLELRPAGLPATQPSILNFDTFHPNGTLVAVGSNGFQSSAHGTWVRVGDRKFLGTVFSFSFNENRVLTTIMKVRVNLQLSADGQTLKGTNEVVLMDQNGKVTATLPGGTSSGVRLSPEIPADFYDFQKVQ